MASGDPARFGGRLLRLARDDRGAAATSFILTFPIFLTIVAVIVQLGLIVNAQLVLNHASYVAARSAAACLPEDKGDHVRPAAYMILASISPSGSDSDPDADAIAAALGNIGFNVLPTYARRFHYAAINTQIHWTFDKWADLAFPPSNDETDLRYRLAQEVKVTVDYRFLLTVPVAGRIVATFRGEAAPGVRGDFLDMRSTCSALTNNGVRSGWNFYPGGPLWDGLSEKD